MCYLQCVASVRLRVPYVRTHGLPCIGEGSQRALVQTPPGSGKAFLVHTRCLDMSLIIPGTRWPAGSPSHIGARAPPALRGRALFKRWFKRVLHVSGLQVWDFARPRRNIRRAPQRCVGMRHPSARVRGDIPAFTPRHQKNTHKCSWKHLATFSFQRESDNGKVLFL